jgi:TetR/AcrR family transcriptional repressor of nem operon
MTESETMADLILDAAERRARRAGYHGFSFRDVAADVGIKSASVHYHFPTKAMLAGSLTDRYRQRALDALGDPAGLSPQDAVDRLAALFLAANDQQDLMCLCGVLGGEAADLPDAVQAALGRFFGDLDQWLARAFAGHDLPIGSGFVLATLQGALLIARNGGGPGMLRTCIDQLRALVPQASDPRARPA